MGGTSFGKVPIVTLVVGAGEEGYPGYTIGEDT
jgi:hypothetical protein